MVYFNPHSSSPDPFSSSQEGKSLPPMPLPSLSDVGDPIQSSSYLQGTLSSWISTNAGAIPKETLDAVHNILNQPNPISTKDAIEATTHVAVALQAVGAFPTLGSLMLSHTQQMGAAQESAFAPYEGVDNDQAASVKLAMQSYNDLADSLAEASSSLHEAPSSKTMSTVQAGYSAVCSANESFTKSLSALQSSYATIQTQVSEQQKAASAAAGYQWQDYDNNWSGSGYPPTGASGDLAFAVVNSDGSFNSDYPIGNTTDAGLAIGGWNNSQQGQGLYQVLTQPLNGGQLTAAQQNLLNNIADAAQSFGYSRVTMDFEDYFDPNASQVSQSYTTFLEQLGSKLHSLSPPVQLQMAISPSITNQNFFNMNALLSSGAVDKFQVMSYDYEQGGTPATGIASVSQTQQYLQQMLNTYPELNTSKLLIGFPLYGAGYSLPPGLTPAEVMQALSSGSGVTMQSGEVGDNTILQNIGNWQNPTNGFQMLTNGETPPSYFYYNATTGQLYNTFPPQSMQDFASMIKNNFPGVGGFFGWESPDDTADNSMYTTMMNDIMSSQTPVTLSQAQQEIVTWLQGLENTIPSLASWAQGLISQVDSTQSTAALATLLNQTFTSSSNGQDIYMQYPALLEVGGKLSNQIQNLFSQNPNLLYMDPSVTISVPAPTKADLSYAQLVNWQPTDPGGVAEKNTLMNVFLQNGSGWSQQAMNQYYWQNLYGQPSLSTDDQSFLSSILYGYA
jgi:hypothetical protein